MEGYFKYTAYSKLLDGLGISIDSHGLAVKLMGVFGEKKVLPGQGGCFYWITRYSPYV
ncbi:MAG: hypothetical protein OTI34_11155 [Lewinella sp.]|nr:hypothetical protein [Lewinella sp.]